eukprot:gnl/TRDRNA2_/TRDRNA2_52257_c0_seq2.p2 gnl/TRDRNA2_/TRDRNA2_52257_c0~~gnl/TRDRNA2_/TRDRNA2_52257_c0_seq2.p2  ORF type:complete len:196 (-),score=40.84 gnl/TRDRNA2_/TRDRNA2_52257_c0_seq2:132-719(-)
MLKNPPYQQWKDKMGIGRKSLKTLSPAVQAKLASGLAVPAKSRFDDALNALRLDEATREAVVSELRREVPALSTDKAAELVSRCFRRKVNTLRCLGQQILLGILDEVLPGAAKAAVEAAGGSAAAAPAARARRRCRHRSPASKAASTAGNTSVAADGSAAMNGGLSTSGDVRDGDAAKAAAADVPKEPASKRLRA